MEWVPVIGPLLGKVMDFITIKYLLGAGFGPALVMVSAFLAYKMLQWHKDEEKTFNLTSLPGVMAAFMAMVIMLLGVFLVIWNLVVSDGPTASSSPKARNGKPAAIYQEPPGA